MFGQPYGHRIPSGPKPVGRHTLLPKILEAHAFARKPTAQASIAIAQPLGIKVGGDLEGLMDDLGQRFARKSKAVPTPKPIEDGQ